MIKGRMGDKNEKKNSENDQLTGISRTNSNTSKVNRQSD